MTAAAVTIPFADASPAEIRAVLLPEDHPEFDRQWRAALTVAADTLSLDEVKETLESWRRVAWLTTVHGPEAYRRRMAQAEHTLRTGEAPPGTVGSDVVEALIAERLGR